MDRTQAQQILRDRVDMIRSLNDSLMKAGGCPRTWEEAKKLTLEQMVEQFAQNGIRFTYQTPPITPPESPPLPPPSAP